MTKPADLDSSPLSGTKRRFIPFDKIHHRLSMGARKKSRPNSEAPANDSGSGTPPAQTSTTTAATPENTQQPSSESPKETSPVSKDTAKSSTIPIQSQSKSLDTQVPRKSWYGGGSWRAKASPVAQVAKEGVTVIGGVPSGSEAIKPSTPNSSAPFLAKRRTSKGDPIAASMTKLNVTCNNGNGSQADLEATEAEPETVTEPAPLPPDPTKGGGAVEAEKTQQADSKKQPQASGWRIWWSRPDGYVSGGEEADKSTSSNTVPEDAKTTPLPGLTPMEDPATQKPLEVPVEPDQKQTQQKDTVGKEAEANAAVTDAAGQSKSWFWLWSNTQNTPTSQAPAVSEVEAAPPNEEPPPVSQLGEQTSQSDAALEQTQVDGLIEQQKSDTATSSNKSSGWAFWSRSTQKSQGDTAQEVSHKEVGELAVADTPSQSRPEAAQYNEEEQPQKDDSKSVRGKPKEKTKKKAMTPAQPVQAAVLPENATAAESAAKIAAKTQQPQNHILPEFNSTFSPHQTPSYWQQLRRYIVKHESGAPHLYIAPPPPKIKKAIAIGIHGYFPAPLIQKVIGQPTGTSIRFANAAAAAIEEWTKERGYACDIEKVALEGEGFIADRVSTLWNLLLNWIDHIKSADFILVACHSQGVPVAVMLVAKLIAFGCVNAAKIGICAMAGVNQGPFAEFKTRFFGGSAAELFEFSRPKSTVSQMYITALEEVLNHGVRIVYVGSLDDQLVSLDSSTFSSISHPYIYRAVFIDGRTQAPDFITGLVSFALKLRNLGLPDHGLIRELSPALAGSIYSGEGHSRLYEEPKVYKLAVQHALETTSLPQNSSQSSRPASFKLKVKEYDNGANSIATNPFFLPWAMRGILEEEFVKREMQREVDELLSLFEAWRPTAKPLKDVRFRLEAVRSKL